MNEIDEIKEKFAKEFYKTCDLIQENYVEHSEEKNAITGSIIIRLLHQMQLDIENLTFRSFVDKYIPNADYLTMNDYTYDECVEIIKKANLSKENRKLAELFVLERKNWSQIYKITGVEPRTSKKAWDDLISKELRKTGVKIRFKGKE